MQNRNPSPKFSNSFLDQAFERARQHLAAEPLAGDQTSAASGDELDAAGRTVEQLLGGPELLRVLREPIEWLLALAHRLADEDPVDVASVARLRAAFLAKVAGRSVGIRVTDLLVVSGLLLGALDPVVVIRALSDTFGDGLAAILGAETPLAIRVTSTIDPFATLRTTRPDASRFPRWLDALRSQFSR